ncbi:MAG: hypothetical protein JXA24_00870 [Proteobacteria bacterium]|nr:hypothetical protein [Pseudomonadota bacterium]
MVIGKASPVSDKDFRLRDADMRSAMERQEIVEALRHGNIYEVFAKSKTFKIGDFADFFSNQWKNFKSQIVQDAEIKSSEGAYHEPGMNQFAMHQKGASMTPEEGQLLSQEMSGFLMGGGKFKAQGAGEFTSDLPDGTPLPDELAGMAEGTLSEWDQFMQDTWGTIFDQQMMSDYRSRMDEIKAEVQRIITLAKQGAIGPEFVLIALAKVNQTKNGCLMTWLGKKAFHVNETINTAARDLRDMSVTDPQYYATLQMAQEKTRDGSFQLNLLTQDMQKVMQDVAGTLEFVHSFLGEINRTRREIITKVSAH